MCTPTLGILTYRMHSITHAPPSCGMRRPAPNGAEADLEIFNGAGYVGS